MGDEDSFLKDGCRAQMSLPVVLAIRATANLLPMSLAAGVGLIYRYMPPFTSGLAFLVVFVTDKGTGMCVDPGGNEATMNVGEGGGPGPPGGGEGMSSWYPAVEVGRRS
jgi:hypothetical protein